MNDNDSKASRWTLGLNEGLWALDGDLNLALDYGLLEPEIKTATAKRLAFITRILSIRDSELDGLDDLVEERLQLAVLQSRAWSRMTKLKQNEGEP